MASPEITFTRLPISLPCPVPIRPSNPDLLDENGEPIALEHRTELCAVDAFWMVGLQPCCDIHARQFCQVAGIDYDDLVAEAGGPYSGEGQNWHDRHRYPQEQARTVEQTGRRGAE